MRLTYLNLFGVLLLGLVCVWQWRSDSHLRAELAARRLQAGEQGRKLAAAEAEKSRLAADLELFRTQLKTQSEELDRQNTGRTDADKKLRQMTAERDQLKNSVTEWVTAVQARDARLAAAAKQCAGLAARLQEAATAHAALSRRADEAIALLNQRTQEGNAVIEQLNARSRECRELTEQLNLRTKEYNELVKKPAGK